ncbi:MAG: multicopper oxidase family protein [Acetobacteraceae bacterium]
MLSRRNAMLSALAAAALPTGPSLAQTPPAGAADPVTVLQVQRRSIEVNGKPASILSVHQPDGTPGLTTKVGQRFRVRLENQLDVPTLIHWHGMTPPWQQDGVPGVSGPPIAPGASGEYDFPLRFGGTFWMHSHEGLQEQALLAAPLIIHDDRDLPGQQEIVVMLADFSFTPAEMIYENLRKGGAMAGMAMPGMAMPAAPAGMAMPGAAPGMAMPGAAPGMAPGMAMPGAAPGMAPGMAMPGAAPGTTAHGMPMPAAKPTAPMGSKPGAAAAPDLNDVTYDAFLANDRTLRDPQVIAVEPGASILLRIINSSAMSAYHLDLGALNGELIAVDGFRVRPIAGRRFPVTVAQRLDIRIKLPREPAAHPILAILEGERSQTGVILKAGSRAAVRRVPDTAAAASAALNYDLERRLRALEPLAVRKADRVHTLDLTGQMTGYVWSINGVVWNPDVPPLPIAKGERVELVFQNRTPMPHPMHLHGHEFQVVEINGQRFPGPVRDTVLVTPGARVVVAFDANNPGLWAMHCHLLYHMDAGMFTTLRYV